MPENSLPSGQQRVGTSADEFNRISFLVSQAINRMQTATIVKIVACTNDGGLTPVGFVDVVPMVNQLDGQGNPTEHVTIFNVPYIRIQGGKNGIILDPEVGDIGVCVFASRDISKVKATKSAGNPGSFRTYNFADGMYLGGVLNGTPEQYVQFNAAGIEIHSPTLIKLTAPDIQLLSQTLVIEASTSVTIDTPTFSLSGSNCSINSSDTCSITADKFQIHAGKSWSWDVAGFGEQWKHTGGVAWEQRKWQVGAAVTTVNLPINPPDGTP